MVFKAAAVQMCSGVDPEKNAESMARLVREAARRGAIYVQTPEMTGAVQKDRAGLAAVLRDEETDLIVRQASELAKELGIHLHVGSTAIQLADGKIANRAFLFGPDGHKITSYDKIHMFDVDLDNGESWRESAVYRPGERAVVADLPFGKLGFGVCYDVRFPHLFRAEAMAGAARSAALVSSASAVVVVFPLEPVMATVWPSRNREANSTSPMMGISS